MLPGRNKLRITDYELRITNYGLRITDYELRITNYGLTAKDKLIESILIIYVFLFFFKISVGNCSINIDIVK